MSPPETAAAPVAVGLDLGTTNIKAGVLDSRGRLHSIRSRPAPPLSGAGVVREGDAGAYLAAARNLLESVARRVPEGTPLGIATQRSSFALWEPGSGRARTPLVSWQDRRAAGWCDAHRDLEPEIVRLTGLPLSAHYAGPKLAALQSSRPELRDALHRDGLLFGTLETLATWAWSGRRVHETDLSVAARTLMADIAAEAWSPRLLERYGVPAAALPRVVPSAGRAVELDCGLTLTATLADQAASAVAVLDPGERTVLVNLGTGTFVLRPVADPALRIPGYLTAPVLGLAPASRSVLEGTINGTGPALDRFGPAGPPLPADDPSPEAFAVPDEAGLGSPFWRPEIGLVLNMESARLDERERRRVVVEGVLFRVRMIIDELLGGEPPERVLVAGGISRDPAIAPGLADLTGRPVELLLEPEGTLLGAARLAAGLPPFADPETRPVPPGGAAYLGPKYRSWRRWLRGIVT